MDGKTWGKEDLEKKENRERKEFMRQLLKHQFTFTHCCHHHYHPQRSSPWRCWPPWQRSSTHFYHPSLFFVSLSFVNLLHVVDPPHLCSPHMSSSSFMLLNIYVIWLPGIDVRASCIFLSLQFSLSEIFSEYFFSNSYKVTLSFFLVVHSSNEG